MASSSRAAAAAGAGGVGVLLTSWVWGDPANTSPANLPSHPHHHPGYADIKELKESDLRYEAPRTVSNSMASLLESYVGPADPVNTQHHFEQPNPNRQARLEVGVESRVGNSVFGLLSNWFGSADQKRTP